MNQILKTEKTSKNEAGSLEENYQKFKKRVSKSLLSLRIQKKGRSEHF